MNDTHTLGLHGSQAVPRVLPYHGKYYVYTDFHQTYIIDTLCVEVWEKTNSSYIWVKKFKVMVE